MVGLRRDYWDSRSNNVSSFQSSLVQFHQGSCVCLWHGTHLCDFDLLLAGTVWSCDLMQRLAHHVPASPLRTPHRPICFKQLEASPCFELRSLHQSASRRDTRMSRNSDAVAMAVAVALAVGAVRVAAAASVVAMAAAVALAVTAAAAVGVGANASAGAGGGRDGGGDGAGVPRSCFGVGSWSRHVRCSPPSFRCFASLGGRPGKNPGQYSNWFSHLAKVSFCYRAWASLERLLHQFL